MLCKFTLPSQFYNSAQSQKEWDMSLLIIFSREFVFSLLSNQIRCLEVEKN